MLLRNSAWNFAGLALPALVALGTVPWLIHGLGLEGFGIVTLITSIVGYFGILDINLSSGAIKYLAEHQATGDQRRFAQTFWFGLLFHAALGLVGGLLLAGFAGVILDRFFAVSAALRADAEAALQLAALGFALSQLLGYLLAVPQALQRYDVSARGEAAFGIVVNILSAIVACSGGGIAGVVLARVAVSAGNVLWLGWQLSRLQSQLNAPLSPCMPSRDVCVALMRFSSFSYLSRLAAMLHQHADKLIIGALAGPVALAFYTVPVQLAGRILGLTYRLASVIYPRVSELAATGRQAQLQRLYLDATRLLTYLNFAVLAVIALAGAAFLERWVGAAFVVAGYPVLLLVTLALLADSLTTLPSLVNDGLGHPQVSGRFAFARGLAGVPLVWIGTLTGGIEGAALAHLLASLVMSAWFLAWVHGRTVPVTLARVATRCWRPALLAGLGTALAVLPLKWLIAQHWPGLGGLLALLAVSGTALSLAGIAFVLHAGERAMLRARISTRLGVTLSPMKARWLRHAARTR
ncbi:MAG: hypothetical protein RL404_2625 [Pseudomonadota bacterium]|jgi:O-antigen/teichoic acid export membrane protein